MIKNKILLISFIILTFGVKAEDFYVLHIKGQIVVNSQDIVLKLGDKLTNDDQVMFIGKGSVAVVLSSSRGRLRLENKRQSSVSEFTYIVNSFSSPSQGTLSTRGAGDIYSVKDLKEHVKGASYNVIDSCMISLPRKLSINDGSYYYYGYEYQGVKVKKVFPIVNNKLLVDSSIYNVLGKQINTEKVMNGMLYYYSYPSKQAVPIEQFSPNFISKLLLIDEIKTFLIIQKSLNKISDKPFEDVLAFLQEVYGNIDKTRVNKLYTVALK